MSNLHLLQRLRALRASISSGQASIDEAYYAFEGLTNLLENVTKSDERTLHDLVNDVERIRFTLLPENQPSAVCDVLDKAETLFESYC